LVRREYILAKWI